MKKERKKKKKDEKKKKERMVTRKMKVDFTPIIYYSYFGPDST